MDDAPKDRKAPTTGIIAAGLDYFPKKARRRLAKNVAELKSATSSVGVFINAGASVVNAGLKDGWKTAEEIREKERTAARPCLICGNPTTNRPTLFGPKSREFPLIVQKFGARGQFGKEGRICDECGLMKVRCAVTRLAFPMDNDLMPVFLGSQMRRDLAHYSQYGQISGYLSPSGMEIIKISYETFKRNFATWVAGSREESIPTHRILREIGAIRTYSRCRDLSEVRAELKVYSAQLGGNAYINFRWARHRDGGSRQTSPREASKWWSGTATTVLVDRGVRRRKSSGNIKRKPSGQ